MIESSLAVITARGGSKRIPRKNILKINDYPMIYYPIQAAITAGVFSEVMVSTDDNEIADLARSIGAKVPFMRSSKNAGDHATISEVLLEVLSEYAKQGREFTSLCCLFGTSIFVTADKLKEGISCLKTSGADSVIAVVPFEAPLERALSIHDDKLAFIHPEYIKTRSQDLDPAYHEAGQMVCLNVQTFMQKKAIYTDNVFPLVWSTLEAHDIDSPSDLALARLKLQLLNKGQ